MAATQVLRASTSVSFSSQEAAGVGDLRLVEDQERQAEAESRVTPKGLSVSCTKSRYVRLYPKNPGNVKVTALTGSVGRIGDTVEHDVSETATFTTEQVSSDLPPGVENVRVEVVGLAFDGAGDPVSVKAKYDKVRNQIVISPGAFCVCRVMYDYPYTLYIYNFSGDCPDDPPQKFDKEGNPLDLKEVKNFDDGLLTALDPVTKRYASLTLTPPSCTYSAVSGSWLDSDRTMAVPQLKVEMDPNFPPRLVADGSTATVECAIRVYPAGAAVSATSTSGILRKAQGVGTRVVNEVKTFQGSATASLEYPPASGVQARIIGSLQTIDPALLVTGIYGPGQTVTDVTYADGGNGRYYNPRDRVLGSSEIAACDSWGHPIPVHGLVAVNYSSLYDLYVFRFARDPGPGVRFQEAFAIFEDMQARAVHISLNPPSGYDRSRPTQ